MHLFSRTSRHRNSYSFCYFQGLITYIYFQILLALSISASQWCGWEWWMTSTATAGLMAHLWRSSTGMTESPMVTTMKSALVSDIGGQSFISQYYYYFTGNWTLRKWKAADSSSIYVPGNKQMTIVLFEWGIICFLAFRLGGINQLVFVVKCSLNALKGNERYYNYFFVTHFHTP